MNITLWVLQVLLALHTLIGALWKFTNSAQSIPALQAIPHGVWLAMSGVEILCSVGLLLPIVNRRLGTLAPLAAACIGAEMLLFCGLLLASGDTDHSPMLYWLIVASLCAFIAYGRWVRNSRRSPGAV